MEYGIANILGQPSMDSIVAIIHTTLKNGITYFDTASSYGKSEELLGKAFNSYPTKKNISILTKLPTDYVYHSLQSLEDVVSLSLSKLQLKTLWCLYTHRESNIPDWDSFGYSINILKKKGLLKHTGVSVYTVDEAIRYADNCNVDVIQIPTNVIDRRFLDSGFFQKAKTAGKKVFIRSIYLQGLLFLTMGDLKKKNMVWAWKYFDHLNKFLFQNNLNLKQFAIKGVLQKFPETVLVIGVESPQQLKDNISLFNSPDLNPDIIDQWWTGLSVIPDRLLNPSFWNKVNA